MADTGEQKKTRKYDPVPLWIIGCLVAVVIAIVIYGPE